MWISIPTRMLVLQLPGNSKKKVVEDQRELQKKKKKLAAVQARLDADQTQIEKSWALLTLDRMQLRDSGKSIAEKERQLTEREKGILDEADKDVGMIHAEQTQKLMKKREKQVHTDPMHFGAQQLEKDQKEQEEAKEIKIDELVAHVRAIADAYSRLQNNNRGQQNWVRELQRMVDGLQKDCTE